MRPTFVRPDGGVSQVVCAAGVDPDAEAARIAGLPDYAGWTYVGTHEAPASRRFRQSWRHAADALSVDLPLARGQRLAELRAERDALLAAADALTMKALDTGTVEQRQDVAA
ncbi:hypothetical protein, partial [Methylibium sp.]|uniref:hypothetical protein n=1 Tax=Methylibium sp. TaxID=2067992 RepID=UPI00183EBB9A